MRLPGGADDLCGQFPGVICADERNWNRGHGHADLCLVVLPACDLRSGGALRPDHFRNDAYARDASTQMLVELARVARDRILRAAVPVDRITKVDSGRVVAESCSQSCHAVFSQNHEEILARRQSLT